jgi:glyoxylase-like metal-dependent hydrolase (beta-lactamase superfamily II)
MERVGADILVETVYPGVNVGCVMTGDGAVCIDTPLLPGEAQRWRERIRSLGAEEVRFVIYSTGGQDRVLGTQYFVLEEPLAPRPPSPPASRASRPRHILFPYPTPPTAEELRGAVLSGSVVAHKAAWEQVKVYSADGFKQSMADTYGERDPDMEKLQVILPQITFDERAVLYAGDVVVTLVAAGPGVAWVWLPEQRVLFASDTVVVGTHPPLDVLDIRQWLAALKRLRDDQEFQGAAIVPGRGPVCDGSAIEPLSAYLSKALERTRRICRAGRPKAELNGVAADLLPLYPVADGQKERVQRQIKLGLDALYDELRSADGEPD